MGEFRSCGSHEPSPNLSLAAQNASSPRELIYRRYGSPNDFSLRIGDRINRHVKGCGFPARENTVYD